MKTKRLKSKVIKKSKSIQESLKAIKEGRTFPYKDILKEWKKEEKWEKKHPILTKFKRIWWWMCYGIKNKIKNTPLRIKTFIQRGKKGWAISDTWNFDSYLSKVISEGLKHLKNNAIGLPTWKEGQSEKKAQKEWNKIMNIMIKTFETAQKISGGDIYYISSKEYTYKKYKTMKRISSKSKIKVLNKKETLEFEKGFDLLKEWFFALWD